MRKKIIKEKQPQFIIVNEFAQVFCELLSGYPNFTDDWNKAKPLNNKQQFQMVQRGTLDKLEMMYID